MRAPLGPLLFFASWAIAAAAGGCVQPADDAASPGMIPPVEDASSPPPAPDSSACRPGDVQTYQPGTYHGATASGQGVCDAAAIQGFEDACLGANATNERCTAFKNDPMTAACAHCIDTPDSETRYGPLVDHGTFITPNVAGCIELSAPSSLQCAKALQALTGCELAACEANCPVQDAASRAAYDACAAQADTGGCRSFQMAVAACVPESAAQSAVAPCLAANFADFYAEVVPVFCAAPQAARDAGSPLFDASPDGPLSSRDARADAPPGVSDGGRADAAADARVNGADATTDAPSDATLAADTGAAPTGDAAQPTDAAWNDAGGYGGGQATGDAGWDY